MNKNLRIALVAILLIAVLLFKLYNQPKHTSARIDHTQQNDHSQTQDITPPTEPPHSPGGEHQSVIDPDVTLKYTRHARCRMDCRHISEADIKEVLREGHINEAKSQQNESPCPTYAIEDDRNADGVRLRIVFAKCEQETKVVTCIDRDHEFECDCK